MEITDVPNKSEKISLHLVIVDYKISTSIYNNIEPENYTKISWCCIWNAYQYQTKDQCAVSGTQPETILSSTGFAPQDLDTDSKSFSISGAHLMKARFQKLYLGFWHIQTYKFR